MDASAPLRLVSSFVGNLVGSSVAATVGAAVGSQVSLRAGIWRQPRPMPHQVAAWLDHPARLRYRNPGATLGLLGLFGGMTVLDLGCGTGLFTAEMARMVGAEGTVHAVDLQPAMLALARTRMEKLGLAAQVQFHAVGAYDLPLRDSSVDVAALIAVLGEIPDRSHALAEIRRVLKPGARLAVSEELPDPAYVPARLARKWAEAAGFGYGGKTGSPLCYSMIFFNHK
jgi:ubiquinone/menaquinone biosynthesis C-methylase UbiE